MIGDWTRELQTGGKLVQGAGDQAGVKVATQDGLKPGTINNYLGKLVAVLNWCAKPTVGLLDKVPEVEMIDFDDEEVIPLEQAQFDALILACSSRRLQRFLHLLVGTGARWASEMMKLTWDRVDLSRNSGATIKFGSLNARTKTGKSRTIVVADYFRDILVEMRTELQQAGVYSETGPVFMINDQGEWKAWKNPTSGFETAREKAGISEDFTLHGLRHTHAAWMLKDGMLIQDLSKFLGHANIQTTDKIYGHLKAIDVEIGAALMQKRFASAPVALAA